MYIKQHFKGNKIGEEISFISTNWIKTMQLNF